MAAVVEARETSITTPASNTHVVDLPAGIQSGERLIAGIAFRGLSDVTFTWPEGWSEIRHLTTTGPITLSVAEKMADGAEGATISVTTSGNAGLSAHGSLRISGGGTPEVSTGAVSGGSVSHPDPDSLTPSGGSQEYLWIAITAVRRRPVTAAPANYANLNAINHGDTLDTEASFATAERTLTASSEDPGTFTLGTISFWCAATIAIPPAADEGRLVGRSVHYDFATKTVTIESGV